MTRSPRRRARHAGGYGKGRRSRQRATPQTASSSAHACLRRRKPDLGCCLSRDQRQKRSRSLGFLARRPSRRVQSWLSSANSSSSQNLKSTTFAPRSSGWAAKWRSSAAFPSSSKATTNRHDLPRTVLLAPLLDQINCVRKPADEGCVDHCGCPYLATARPVAVARRSAIPPQGRRGFPSARR